MIDVVVQHEDISELWWNAFILLLLLFQNIPMHVLCMRELSIALRRMETRLRSALARQLQRLSIGYYTHASAGVLQTKVVRDVEAIEQMVRQLFDGGLGALSNLVGALVITALRAPAFLPFFVVMVPVSAMLVQTMRKTLTVHNQRFRTEVERMAAHVSEMTHLIPITRAHGLERNELDRIDSTLTQVRAAGLELVQTNAIFGSVSWVTYNIFNMICLVVAAWVVYYQIIPITAGESVPCKPSLPNSQSGMDLFYSAVKRIMIGTPSGSPAATADGLSLAGAKPATWAARRARLCSQELISGCMPAETESHLSPRQISTGSTMRFWSRHE